MTIGGDAAGGAGFRARGHRGQLGTGRLGSVLAPSVASQPGVKEWYGRVERYAASPGTALAKMRAISELDVRNVLPLVAAPTLVVDDLTTGPSAAHGHYLAEHIAGARLLERDSEDHWPIGDADLLGAIEEFVSVRARTTAMSTASWRRCSSGRRRLDRARDRDRRPQLGRLLGRFETTADPVLRDHRGELVSTAGDGLLGPSTALPATSVVPGACATRSSRPASRCDRASTPAN